jgi:flavin reductase
MLRKSFLDAMSLTAATVNVVTTDGPGGRAGVTVSAMTSVSADGAAPMLLVCIHHLSRASAAILLNGAFCVNVLREDQQEISDVFGGRAAAADDRFAGPTWLASNNGLPRLADPLAVLDCRLAEHQRYGTHHVLMGVVEDVHVPRQGRPLVYCNRSYAALALSG